MVNAMVEEKVKENKTKKKLVKINITGKELLENGIIQTTYEELAKIGKIYDPKLKYGPMTIIVGEKEVFPQIEEELNKMVKGEVKKIKLLAKDAFGERDSNKIRVLPLIEFTKKKINPFPGLIISADNMQGKVQSVSGGRVRVDFNHPLAGRALEYEVKLEKEIKDINEIAEAFFDKYYSMIPQVKKEIKGNELKVIVKSDIFKNLEKLNEMIQKMADSFELKIILEEAKEEKKGTKEEKAEGEKKASVGVKEKTKEVKAKTPIPKSKTETTKIDKDSEIHYGKKTDF